MSMYLQHFGFQKRPFHATVTGSNVFVGPQIAATMAGLKKSLASKDAIVTVRGPVGSGKTTLVTRALESVGETRHIVAVARMRLDSDDVLELLLDELGVEDRPTGTIRKFAAFRHRLKELEDDNCRVFVSVEDGVRLGADTLAEIEALTSADAGVSEGASVVIMGDERLDDVLLEAQMARIQQRIRQRYTAEPLCAAELRGYLRHCFRLAGADFERLFEVNGAPLLHHLCDGIPRVANNLVESALSAAAEQGLQQVPSALLASVAEGEYGLSAAGFDMTPAAVPQTETPTAPVPAAPSAGVPEPTAEVAPEIVPEPAAEVAPEVLPEPVPDLLPEPTPALASGVAPESVPQRAVETVAATKAAEPAPETDPLPELIQDTLPDLEILAPELTLSDPEQEAEHESEPASASEPDFDPAPVADIETQAETKQESPEVPAWDRDPTMAELKPDLDALEQALALAQSDAPEPPGAAETKDADIPELIPEITLDHAINQRIANKVIDEPGEVSPTTPAGTAKTQQTDTDKPAVSTPPARDRKADSEVDKIAAELAKAKSIEDVDDRMAETLFGGELSLAASQVFAKPPLPDPANEDIDKAVTEEPQQSTPSNDGVDIEVTLEAPGKLDDGGLDLSASQRLKTVRALNADLHPSLREPKSKAEVNELSPPTPESIEDQINISMTQTLKALNVKPPVSADDDDYDEEGESRSGFFSRFKRS